MEKVNFAPIDSVNYESNLQELTKEEREAAGIIVDYEVEEVLIKEKPKRPTPKKYFFNNYMRWILLSILILFITIIITLGLTCIRKNEQIDYNNQTASIIV